MILVNKKEHRMWLMLPFVAFFIIALSIYFLRLKRQKTTMNHNQVKRQSFLIKKEKSEEVRDKS